MRVRKITAAGAECDLVLEKGRRRVAVECKASLAPQVTRGFWESLADLKPERAWVAAPVGEGFPLKDGAEVLALPTLLERVGGLG